MSASLLLAAATLVFVGVGADRRHAHRVGAACDNFAIGLTGGVFIAWSILWLGWLGVFPALVLLVLVGWLVYRRCQQLDAQVACCSKGGN